MPLLFLHLAHPPRLSFRATTRPPHPRYPPPHLSMQSPCPPTPSPAILLTNDDGLHPSRALILPLAQRLTSLGHTVLVVAPGTDNSACGQRLTLNQPLSLRRHPDHERRFTNPDSDSQPPPHSPGKLMVFSLDVGTPTDCVIAGLKLMPMLHLVPRLAVSGVNLGQNLGNDVLYSGTFAAARQAAMYGVPAIATSVNLFVSQWEAEGHTYSVQRAIDATAQLVQGAWSVVKDLELDVERKCGAQPMRLSAGGGGGAAVGGELREAFVRGDCVFNVNVPVEWEGGFELTRLDCVLYRGAMRIPRVPANEGVEVRIGGVAAGYSRAAGSDVVAVLDRGVCSVTPVSTWPIPHPMALADMLEKVVGEEMPTWLMGPAEVGAESKDEKARLAAEDVAP